MVSLSNNGIEDRNFKHGHAVRGEETPTYKSWHAMMSRCRNRPDYENVPVYDDWWEFENFLKDMGKKPTGKHTIGRIDHSKGYEPGNCEWQTRAKQARNAKRTKVTMAIAREIRMQHRRGYTLRELAEEFGIHHSTVFQIVNRLTWKEMEG